MEQIGSPQANKGDALTIVTGNYEKMTLCSNKVEEWIKFYDKLQADEQARNKK